MAKCQRCRSNTARQGLMFCGPCETVIRIAGQQAKPSGRPTIETFDQPSNSRRLVTRTEHASGFTRNGLTYASLNGREVCPDVLIVHGSVDPADAAQHLAWLRAQVQPTTVGPDLEWDPPAPGEVIDQ